MKAERTNICKYSTRLEECLGAAMPVYKFALGWSVALRATLCTARDVAKLMRSTIYTRPEGSLFAVCPPPLCGKAFRTVLLMCASFRPGTRHRGCHNSDGSHFLHCRNRSDRPFPFWLTPGSRTHTFHTSTVSGGNWKHSIVD